MALHLSTVDPAVASQTRIAPTKQIVIALLNARDTDFLIRVILKKQFTASIHVHDHHFRRVCVVVVIRVAGLLPDLPISEHEDCFAFPPFEIAINITLNGGTASEASTSTRISSRGDFRFALLKSFFGRLDFFQLGFI